MSVERWSIPSNWCWVTAGEIADIVGGGTPSSKDETNFAVKGIPWLTPADLTGYLETYIERGARDLSEKGYKTSSAKLMPAGTVLFSSRAPIGYCVIARNEISTNQGFKSFVLPADLVPEYVRYYLISAIEYAESIASGTTFKELSGSRAATIPIPVAPTDEQRRIVAKLDALFARTRQAREELEHIPTLIEHYKQAILAAAFRGELTADWRASNQCDVLEDEAILFHVEYQREELWKRLSERDLTRGKYKPALEIDWKPHVNLPGGWIWVSVDQLVALTQYGTSSKTTEEDLGIPVLRMGNIQDGRLDLSSLKFLPEDHDEFPKLLLDEGDILFNRTNSAELVGKSAVMTKMDRKISFASYLIRLKASGMDPSLLVYYINSPFGRDWVASVVTQQVGQANVNGTKLRELGVPLMSPEEQFEIRTRLDKAFAWLDTVLDEATSALRLLDHLDQATLAKAFRGELVPQDPDDEPASVLLERIREARAAGSNGKKRKKRG